MDHHDELHIERRVEIRATERIDARSSDGRAIDPAEIADRVRYLLAGLAIPTAARPPVKVRARVIPPGT